MTTCRHSRVHTAISAKNIFTVKNMNNVLNIYYYMYSFIYLGNNSVLSEEIYRQKRYGKVYSVIRANGPIPKTGNVTLMNIHVDADRSLVSLITMIFPSPDWFLGVSNIDMCDRMTGEWKDSLDRDLFPYDSGTDDGISFESPDAPSNPRTNITLISKDDNTTFKTNSSMIKRLGTFKFSKIPTKACKGKAYYTLTFDAEWSNVTHPSSVFPRHAKFSTLIGASHNSYYEIWRRGKMASTGVQIVAETGKDIVTYVPTYLPTYLILV